MNWPLRTYPAWTFKLDDAHAVPSLPKQVGSNPAYVRSGDHRHRLVERLQVTGNHAIVACRRNVPCGVLHEPARAQERHRHRHLAQRLLHQRALSEQVDLVGLRADRREADDLARSRLQECGGHSINHCARFGKPGLRIELRRRQDENAGRAFERGGERRRVFHESRRDFAPSLCPSLCPCRIAHDCAHRLSGSQQLAGQCTAHLAGDSCDCIHCSFSVCGDIG
ncbi:hypothetical protein FEP80_01855 [Burkholderia multivorans]|nr:hypothetical protein [Burkholderia multivorans]MDR8982115.1 hypothetical protein [Burkholderia multivorans]